MASMAEPNTPFPLTASRSEQIFPTLTSAQIARVAKYGSTRTVHSGEILVDQGDRAVPFLVVISGELEVVRPTGTTETLLLIVRTGQFTGDRPSFAQTLVSPLGRSIREHCHCKAAVASH